MINKRKAERTIGIAPVFRWVCLAILLGAYGLVLVNVSHRAIRLGQETAGKEERLKKLVQENELATAHIAMLLSPQEIRRRLVANNSTLVKIPESRIVWLPASAPDEGIRAVSLSARER
jgi:hypothetical protein